MELHHLVGERGDHGAGLQWEQVHSAAISGGVENAFFSDVQRAAVRFIDLFIRILFEQVMQQRRKIAIVAPRRMQISRGASVGSFS